MLKRAHITVFGRVQGVSYRYFTVKKAEELKINGWVRNSKDGTVEIMAEGEEKDLKILTEWCYNGVEEAVVEKIKIQWEDVAEETNKYPHFYIKH